MKLISISLQNNIFVKHGYCSDRFKLAKMGRDSADWNSYYKSWQDYYNLGQNYYKLGHIYYKSGQLLQIGAQQGVR